LLADSEFRHELESQIEPFKGLALGLFFMAVGMSIDLQRVMAEPATIVTGVALLMALKFALLYALGRWPGGLESGEALLLGGVLALGGEFAFVVFAEAGKAGLLDAALRDRLVAIVGLSMAATPLLLAALTHLVSRHAPHAEPRPYDEMHDDHPEVLIAGFGRFGQIVARLLTAQGVPFVGIEHSAEQVDFVRRFGNKIYYGDPARPDLLRAAGAARVSVFVVAIDDMASSLRTVRVLRRLYPKARIYARARDRRHAWQLMDMGVDAIRETFHSSLAMAEQVLVALGLSPEVARERAARFRQHDEGVLRDQHLVYDDEAALMQSANAARKELEQLFEVDRGRRPGVPSDD
jgi:glutathione-regulated potassium-efflux system protein KefB